MTLDAQIAELLNEATECLHEILYLKSVGEDRWLVDAVKKEMRGKIRLARMIRGGD
jgi:hypothetical protein